MTTRESVKYMKQCAPNIKASKMAELLGVSKARVRAILLDEKLPTKTEQKNFYCIVCNTILEKKVNFCSPKCKHEHYYTEVQCLWCGSPKTMRKKIYIRKIITGQKTFCNYSCRHKWYWQNKPTKMGKFSKTKATENVS